MKRTVFTALTGLAVIAAVVTFAYAQQGPPQGAQPGPMMRHQGQMKGRMFQALNLTPEQKSKMETLRSAQMKEMAQLRADAQIAQIDLRDLLRQDNPSDSDVKAKVAAVTKTRGKIMESQVAFGLKMKQVLTPEQRQKLQDLREQHMRRGGQRGWMRPGGGRMFQQHRPGPRGPMMPNAWENEQPQTAPNANM